MADADVAAQLEHVLALEHVAHQACALVQAQAFAVDRGDAGRVLAAMLQHGQAVVQRRRDFGLADDADDSAHALVCSEDAVCTRRHRTRCRDCPNRDQ